MCGTVLGFTYENPILRRSLRRVRGRQCFFSFFVMTSAIMRRSYAPCSNPCLVGGWRSVSLIISISSGPSMPYARWLPVRYVVQSALVHPPKPLPHGRVRPHQQISYPAYARVDLPLVACSQDVPCLPRWAGCNHLQEGRRVCIGQEVIARRQGAGPAPSTSV